MSFFMIGADKRLNGNNKLLKVSALLDWSGIKNYLKKIHKNDVNPQGGPKAFDNLKMFKAILLQQWHSLSDFDTETALNLRLDFMIFTGFVPGEDVPDHTTICRFRNILVEKGIDKLLFEEINRQLEGIGLKIEKAHGAVIDATIIESAARPRKTIVVEQDREESGIEVKIEESKDPDARWLKKGKKCYFGYKGFMTVDTKDGFIQNIHTESANEAEIDKLEKILPEIKAKRVYADKGYDSANNRELLKARNIKDGIMHKARKNNALTARQKLINKLISKKRFIVEQDFGTLKRKFKLARSSYMTKLKVEAQFRLKAICFNLLKAVNKLSVGGFAPCYQ